MPRRLFVISTFAICLGCAGSLAYWRTTLSAQDAATERAPLESVSDSPVQRTVLLRAPDFDDVSEFGNDDITRIDAWLNAQVAMAGYPSLSVAIVDGDDIAYLGSFGFQDVSGKKKATPDTPYHVASVTKVFTTLLAATLHERGVVDLDAPVSSYLPSNVLLSTSPKTGASITLRQLAAHTSGLPRGVPGPVQSVEDRYQLEPKRLYAHLANVDLQSDPGTGELYSNLAMGLLGHALERAAGKPFDDLLSELVCDPLQLEHSAISGNEKRTAAIGYTDRPLRRPSDYSRRERLAPSGGLVASTADLGRFLAANMTPQVLSPETLKQLHTPTKMSDGSSSRTALGWAVRERKSIGRILKKNGGRSNCSAWIGFSPTHRIGVAVVTNCGEPDVDSIGYWLLERSIPGVDHRLFDRKPMEEVTYAKVAPFDGVRWKNERPIVRVQERWSPLVLINGIPIERILEFANRRYAGKARKRFAEDLVEVLSSMGHDPEWDVVLGLKTIDGGLEKVGVTMTEQNRRTAWRH